MNVSMQLYSARNFGPWDGVMKRLAALGYTQVEGFGGVYEDPAAFRALLDENGLTMPSGHFFPLGSFEDGLEKSITAAKTLGMRQLYCPAPEDDLRNGGDVAAWTSFAKRLEKAGQKVRDNGLQFGWHNHHWEFMALAGGEIPMNIILENAPNIEWEADIAWIVRGGANPIEWIEAHKDRITAAHVKDIAPEGECSDEDGWADVGHGTMDWKAITAKLREAGVELFVMEHDNPSDFDRFASRSIEAFKTY